MLRIEAMRAPLFLENLKNYIVSIERGEGGERRVARVGRFIHLRGLPVPEPFRRFRHIRRLCRWIFTVVTSGGMNAGRHGKQESPSP